MLDTTVVIGLLAAITVLAGLASRIGAPYPVVLVLGGLVMGLLPGVPSPDLPPDLVLLLFLPLLVYSAAFSSSAVDMRENAGAIVRLAVGLVLLTVAAVAAVMHLVVGLPWEVAFVLGAVVGPTDPVAASAVIRRVGAPERIVTVLEGESLVNDGTGITAYAVAVATVTAGAFSWSNAVSTFALAVFAGIALGLVVGWLSVRARALVDDTHVELALSLLTPFVAYIPAEELGGSGVLAAVAAGLYTGAQATNVSSVGSRLQLSAFWDLLEFLLNAVLFVLIGMELPHVLEGVPGGLAGLVGEGLLAAATVLVIRFAWMFSVPAVARALRRGPDAAPGWMTGRARVLLAWSGMRGAVSLALVLAVPLTVAGGRAFPHRDEVVFLGYIVVLATLVVPGLTVGPLARRLGLLRGRELVRQEARARAAVLHAALARIEDLAQDGDVSEEAAERLRSVYQTRLDRISARLDRDEDEATAGRRDGAVVRDALLGAQREALARMRRDRACSTQVLDRISRDLDLEELRAR